MEAMMEGEIEGEENLGEIGDDHGDSFEEMRLWIAQQEEKILDGNELILATGSINQASIEVIVREKEDKEIFVSARAAELVEAIKRKQKEDEKPWMDVKSYGKDAILNEEDAGETIEENIWGDACGVNEEDTDGKSEGAAKETKMEIEGETDGKN
ncbi:unnamed protein product [Blepharisma stoltei]|uniref:Uncharacterized protein n=1 Tax=Blepharisma stoltei TaxID=1481888 RepID=A0AAU9IUI0_9CILI|nr:unnamed protein product [Blepharisma stoltei]